MSERVNVCVIVGNGFDMAAGLGTSTEALPSSMPGKIPRRADSPRRLRRTGRRPGPTLSGS